MGNRGPRPQPAVVAKEKGVYQPVRHEDQISEAGEKMDWVYNQLPPPPPPELNELAKDVWDSQLREAQKVFGYIGFIDLKLFAEYCYVCADMESLKDQCVERMYEDDNGVRRVNPLYQELNKLRKDFLRLSQEFGFSPSARTRVKLEQRNEKPKDKYGGGI